MDFKTVLAGPIPPPPPGGDLFFLPPVLGPSVTGLPDEEVAFVRDEMANLVWAIEKTINGEAQSSSPAPTARTRGLERSGIRSRDPDAENMK